MNVNDSASKFSAVHLMSCIPLGIVAACLTSFSKTSIFSIKVTMFPLFRFSDPTFWSVQLGDHNIDIVEDSQTPYAVEQIIIHPRYKYYILVLS